MKKSLALSIAALCVALAPAAGAENYSVDLTRKASNVYKVEGKKIIIQTRYCYVYGFSEEAILSTSGNGGGEVIFIGSKDRCDVKGIFGEASLEPGKYLVTVSRGDDDWYEVFGKDIFIKTFACISFAIGEEAYLVMTTPSFGKLIFEDKTDCMVEGIYSKLRL